MMETPSAITVFAWFISHQLAILFSQNKPATSNQPAVLFSHNKPASAISHEHAQSADLHGYCLICLCVAASAGSGWLLCPCTSGVHCFSFVRYGHGVTPVITQCTCAKTEGVCFYFGGTWFAGLGPSSTPLEDSYWTGYTNHFNNRGLECLLPRLPLSFPTARRMPAFDNNSALDLVTLGVFFFF
jgi:hypothetical protein